MKLGGQYETFENVGGAMMLPCAVSTYWQTKSRGGGVVAGAPLGGGECPTPPLLKCSPVNNLCGIFHFVLHTNGMLTFKDIH